MAFPILQNTSFEGFAKHLHLSQGEGYNWAVNNMPGRKVKAEQTFCLKTFIGK